LKVFAETAKFLSFFYKRYQLTAQTLPASG